MMRRTPTRIRRLNYGIFLIVSLASISRVGGQSKVEVVTTLPDLREIVEEIGGHRVQVLSIAKGYQDPHFVDAKPSYIMRLRRADLFVQVGLDLEIGWVPSLLEGARNASILWGREGHIDASRGVPLLQVPAVDPSKLRAEGDIHIYGNPHYWLAPENAKIIAENIYDGLVRVSPEDASYFNKNKKEFSSRVDSSLAEWVQMMLPYSGRKIVAFHNSWPYFEQSFGLHIAGFVEPKPGIPPSPKQVQKTIKKMREQNIRVIIISPYYSKKVAERIVNEVGGLVVELAPSVGGVGQADDYFTLFDYNTRKLINAFEKMDEDE